MDINDRTVSTTLRIKVESSLNSLTLTLFNDYHNILQVLTINHFLTGKSTKYFNSNQLPKNQH